MKKKIFIGVAWPYVNGDLHIGHLAGYLLPADIFARYHRLVGNSVLMVSGSDCYGTPTTVEADKLGIRPEDVVALYHPRQRDLFDQYGISFDLFTKTTSDYHHRISQSMFVTLAERGYLYTKTSDQYYDSVYHRFLPDRYVEGTCPHCGYESARGDQCDVCGALINQGALINPVSKLSRADVILKSTEHYYFKLSAFQSFLRSFVRSHEGFWREWIVRESYGWLETGLEDRCITRDLDWGVSIPVDRLPGHLRISGIEHKRMYVWFEAVIGYLSATVAYFDNSDEWRSYWYGSDNLEHYYFMGKDNLIFHSLLWPAQLYGYDELIHLPDYLVINQFLTLEGKKFSKSRNIIVDSAKAGSFFGVDAVRFYLTYIMPENADSNFSWSHFVDVINTILVGKIGNYIYRTQHLGKDLSFADFSPTEAVVRITDHFVHQSFAHLELCHFKDYLYSVVECAEHANRYVNTHEPWRKKDDVEYLQVVGDMYYFLMCLYVLLLPLLPHSMERLGKMLAIEVHAFDSDIHGQLLRLVRQSKTGRIEPLFGKIDLERIDTHLFV